MDRLEELWPPTLARENIAPSLDLKILDDNLFYVRYSIGSDIFIFDIISINTGGTHYMFILYH